jgi:hypothetical protein
MNYTIRIPWPIKGFLNISFGKSGYGFTGNLNANYTFNISFRKFNTVPNIAALELKRIDENLKFAGDIKNYFTVERNRSDYDQGIWKDIYDQFKKIVNDFTGKEPAEFSPEQERAFKQIRDLIDRLENSTGASSFYVPTITKLKEALYELGVKKGPTIIS